jgi:hypothetical protein
MNKDLDIVTYMIAAEKMSNLLFLMEQTLGFMNEYKVEADDEVKKCLIPLLEGFNKWVK